MIVDVGRMKTKTAMIALLMPIVIAGMSFAGERHTSKAFKGYELYGWKDVGGAWAFALLPGANRMKSAHEIKEEKNRITGMENVEKRFEGPAQGELVFWYHRNSKAFEYPEEKIQERVMSASKRANVMMHLPKSP